MDDKSFTIRVSKRWARIAMIVGVTTLVVAPLTAVATHSFSDVPNTHTFHADIEWLKSTGVTKGCNPPGNTQFCPDDFVTRGQMSAFMHRFSDRLSTRAAFNSDENGDNTSGTKTLSTQITAPGPGILVMTGGMVAFAEFGDETLTCWLEVNDTAVHGSQSAHEQVLGADNSCTSTGAMTVGAGTHTVDLEGSGPDWYWDESVWVTWVPLDGSGSTP